jgi:putative endonuclease
MAEHNEFGKEGEDLAVRWLTRKAFRVIHRNWRYSHLEVDIIALKDQCLHFVEVKTRRNDFFGHPEDFVTKQKLDNLMRAGAAFLKKYPDWNQVQYDILSITYGYDGTPGFFFVEDVYWW